MRIAPRIISIFLPLFLAPMVFITFAATSTARDAITSVATSFLRFKAQELMRFADSENQLLVSNNLSGTQAFVSAVEESIANYATGLVRGSAETIVAFGKGAEVKFSTAPLDVTPEEKTQVLDIIHDQKLGWNEIMLGGVKRVAVVGAFKPFGWTVFVTDRADSFFKFIERITTESILISGFALVAVIVLIIVFSRLLTAPLKQVVHAMQDIVHTGDLSRRVTIEYADEVGDLGNSFNSMTGALQQAYSEIKNYALQAAIAQKREMKIRNIFQKYVPNQVIEQFFASPESMLFGQDRELAVLFSDIRGFTTMSERMSSSDIVESLNQYFGRMVEVVMRNNGLVDKYIGDAVMAFFGAPADDEDSCYHSVLAGLEMLGQLDEFNGWQHERGRESIHIGVGINYGSVTIGNIGSEHKMDYTVVGDMVNVASRLEGLTRFYDEPLLISESIYRRVNTRIACRLVDRVQVKGRTRGFAVYSVRQSLTQTEEQAWKLHDRGVQHYYSREFAEAARYFQGVLRLLPEDPISPIFIQRCRIYEERPPAADWTGIVAYSEK